MQIIGHRGAAGLEEENSLASIQRAIAVGVHGIEIDIRQQGTTLVLSHDTTLQSASYCTLDEALRVIDGGAIELILDIKESIDIDQLLQTVDSYQGAIIFSSTHFKVLQDIKRLRPDALVAVIESWSGVRAVASAALLRTNRIHINQQWLWSNFVKSMIGKGFVLYPYTVNTRTRAKELEEWGVSGIITDYPNRFITV